MGGLFALCRVDKPGYIHDLSQYYILSLEHVRLWELYNAVKENSRHKKACLIDHDFLKRKIPVRRSSSRKVVKNEYY